MQFISGTRKRLYTIHRVELPTIVLLCLLTIAIHTASAQEKYSPALSKAVAFGTDRPDTAFLLLRSIHDKAIEAKDRETAGLALQEMGRLCYRLGHYSQSLDYHLQAASLFKAAGYNERLATNLNDLGTLYYYNKQTADARNQFDQALALFTNARNNAGLGATYGNIGHLYEKQQQYDSAFYFEYKALDHYKNAANSKGLADIYENLGSIFEDLARYDSATHYYNQARNLYAKAGNTSSVTEILNNQGDILRKTGHYESAMVLTRQALLSSQNGNEPYLLSAALKDLAQEWHLLHRDDSAYAYIEQSRKALLNIYSKENNQQIPFLQVLNQVSKKNSEIEKLTIRHRNTIILTAASILVVILLVILSALIISRQRLKIRNERILAEQDRERFATSNALMEIDLKNQQLQEDTLRLDLEMKARELSTHTLHLIQKNHLLEELRSKLEKMVKDDKRDQKKQLQQLIQQIDLNFNHDQHWDEFRNIFEQVHESFFEKVRQHSDDLTANDLRLIALIKMNINSTDVATLLGISTDSLRVTRYRLRKKLNLPQGDNLSTFIQGL